MSSVKTIGIDQLKPGMFVVGMDQPWHRTPFLFHKRLIRQVVEIELLRQHGIKEVSIDPSKGLDIELQSSANGSSLNDRAETETERTLVPVSEGEAPLPMTPQEKAAAAQATYTEAAITLDRLFAGMETGTVPQSDTLRTVVETILVRVLDDRTSMLSMLSLQQMKRFDRSLASHALDICILSLIIASECGVDEQDREALGVGALLHDIGYIRLPRNLYRKSGTLTEQEKTLMRQHPALGLAIVSECKEERDAVRRVIAEHHERCDGNGFPHGLKGDSLSKLGQIVGLANEYDGMVSRRGGGPSVMPHDAIRQLFYLGSIGQFSKELVESVVKTLGVYPIGSLVQLNTKEQAVVMAVNPAQRLKPIVKIITGPHGESYSAPPSIDLANQPDGTPARAIARVLDPLHEHVNVAIFFDSMGDQAA
jgi:putative nucleotidyltransferase with HDIG domain